MRWGLGRGGGVTAWVEEEFNPDWWTGGDVLQWKCPGERTPCVPIAVAQTYLIASNEHAAWPKSRLFVGVARNFLEETLFANACLSWCFFFPDSGPEAGIQIQGAYLGGTDKVGRRMGSWDRAGKAAETLSQLPQGACGAEFLWQRVHNTSPELLEQCELGIVYTSLGNQWLRAAPRRCSFLSTGQVLRHRDMDVGSWKSTATHTKSQGHGQYLLQAESSPMSTEGRETNSLPFAWIHFSSHWDT